jgi:hypothetical protein
VGLGTPDHIEESRHHMHGSSHPQRALLECSRARWSRVVSGST